MVDFFQPTLDDSVPERDDIEPKDAGIEHTIEADLEEEV